MGKILGLYCVIYVLNGLWSWTYIGETNCILQSLRQRHLNIYLNRRILWQQKAKMPCYNLHRFAIRVCIFFTFCYISWTTLCDVAFSDCSYFILLFHVGSSAFQIATKLAVIVTQWRGITIFTNSAITVSNNNDSDDGDDDDDNDCLIMIVIVAPCCARYLRLFIAINTKISLYLCSYPEKMANLAKNARGLAKI